MLTYHNYPFTTGLKRLDLKEQTKDEETNRAKDQVRMEGEVVHLTSTNPT